MSALDAATLDHLVILAPDLDDAVAEVTASLGVEPLPGGSHPGFGTRNAIVPLRDACYLELLAPDPDQPGGPWADRLAELHKPTLGAWAVRVDDAATVTRTLTRLGVAVRSVKMARRRPDGSTLRWEIGWVGGPAVAPFAIAWAPEADPDRGGRAHPSLMAPPQAAVASFEVEAASGDDARAVGEILDALGLDVAVRTGPADRIHARLEANGRVVDLQGAPVPLRPPDL